MKRWIWTTLVLAAAGAMAAGCGGGPGAEGALDGTERYGMRLYAAGEQPWRTVRSDDFLTIGNAVFVPMNPLAGSQWTAMSDEELQQNFRGMTVYRVSSVDGIAAMDRLQRAVSDPMRTDAEAAARDLRLLLERARQR